MLKTPSNCKIHVAIFNSILVVPATGHWMSQWRRFQPKPRETKAVSRWSGHGHIRQKWEQLRQRQPGPGSRPVCRQKPQMTPTGDHSLLKRDEQNWTCILESLLSQQVFKWIHSHPVIHQVVTTLQGYFTSKKHQLPNVNFRIEDCIDRRSQKNVSKPLQFIILTVIRLICIHVSAWELQTPDTGAKADAYM